MVAWDETPEEVEARLNKAVELQRSRLEEIGWDNCWNGDETFGEYLRMEEAANVLLEAITQAVATGIEWPTVFCAVCGAPVDIQGYCIDPDCSQYDDPNQIAY